MSDDSAVRADVWLWAARFFKTRRLSREAIDGGKVTLNDAGCKPSKLVKAGDRLHVTRGEDRFDIEVLAVSTKRGPATVAQTLYQESEASREAREERRAMARLSRPVRPDARPDKAARRALRRFKHGGT
ncbi:MAG TPA: S4 domain-containing protein [Oleiagrimonas sp.]|nr:S4 domain-containing protein [Oleiagrimonas sp.]